MAVPAPHARLGPVGAPRGGRHDAPALLAGQGASRPACRAPRHGRARHHGGGGDAAGEPPAAVGGGRMDGDELMSLRHEIASAAIAYALRQWPRILGWWADQAATNAQSEGRLSRRTWLIGVICERARRRGRATARQVQGQRRPGRGPRNAPFGHSGAHLAGCLREDPQRSRSRCRSQSQTPRVQTSSGPVRSKPLSSTRTCSASSSPAGGPLCSEWSQPGQESSANHSAGVEMRGRRRHRRRLPTGPAVPGPA